MLSSNLLYPSRFRVKIVRFARDGFFLHFCFLILHLPWNIKLLAHPPSYVPLIPVRCISRCVVSMPSRKLIREQILIFYGSISILMSANPVTHTHSFKGKKCFCALVLKCKGMMLFVTMPKKVLTR